MSVRRRTGTRRQRPRRRRREVQRRPTSRPAGAAPRRRLPVRRRPPDACRCRAQRDVVGERVRLVRVLPSSYQRRPISPPPRTCATAHTTPVQQGQPAHREGGGSMLSRRTRSRRAPLARTVARCPAAAHDRDRYPGAVLGCRPLAMLLVVGGRSRPRRAVACGERGCPSATTGRRRRRRHERGSLRRARAAAPSPGSPRRSSWTAPRRRRARRRADAPLA
jgi:hypothetical protein